jgi:hypothetical protein
MAQSSLLEYEHSVVWQGNFRISQSVLEPFEMWKLLPQLLQLGLFQVRQPHGSTRNGICLSPVQIATAALQELREVAELVAQTFLYWQLCVKRQALSVLDDIISTCKRMGKRNDEITD